MLADHEARIFEALDEGMTQAAIAAELGVMRSSLTRWLNLNESRKSALTASRVIAAEGMVEDARDIADNVKGVDNAEVQAAKLRIETRMKLAAFWDRDKFGEKQAGVTVNIGSLHLDALRAAVAPLQAVEVVDPLAISGDGMAALQSSDSGIIDVEVKPASASADVFGLM